MKFKLFEVWTEELLLGRGYDRLDRLASPTGRKLRPILTRHLVHLHLVDQALNRGLFLLKLGWALVRLSYGLVIYWHFHAFDESTLHGHFLGLSRLVLLTSDQMVVACLDESII